MNTINITKSLGTLWLRLCCSFSPLLGSFSTYGTGSMEQEPFSDLFIDGLDGLLFFWASSTVGWVSTFQAGWEVRRYRHGPWSPTVLLLLSLAYSTSLWSLGSGSFAEERADQKKI